MIRSGEILTRLIVDSPTGGTDVVTILAGSCGRDRGTPSPRPDHVEAPNSRRTDSVCSARLITMDSEIPAIESRRCGSESYCHGLGTAGGDCSARPTGGEPEWNRHAAHRESASPAVRNRHRRGDGPSNDLVTEVQLPSYANGPCRGSTW